VYIHCLAEASILRKHSMDVHYDHAYCMLFYQYQLMQQQSEEVPLAVYECSIGPQGCHVVVLPALASVKVFGHLVTYEHTHKLTPCATRMRINTLWPCSTAYACTGTAYISTAHSYLPYGVRCADRTWLWIWQGCTVCIMSHLSLHTAV
jgi:hypothetical protein